MEIARAEFLTDVTLPQMALPNWSLHLAQQGATPRRSCCFQQRGGWPCHRV